MKFVYTVNTKLMVILAIFIISLSYVFSQTEQFGMFISVTPDNTSPNITLVSPANKSTWSSSSTVTFVYNVTDNTNIMNCSLLRNNIAERNDISITKNTAQIFTKSLSNAYYNWSVTCYDASGNQGNSTVYYLTVSYTESPGDGGTGGGGGGGMFKMDSYH